MGFDNLLAELHEMIAAELEPATFKCLRAANKTFAVKARQSFARQHARIRIYTISSKSWSTDADDDQSLNSLKESLADTDFGPVASALKILLPSDVSVLKRLLTMTGSLPGFRRAVMAFGQLDELILLSAHGTPSSCFSFAYIPGTIFTTVATSDVPSLTQLTILSPQPGAVVRVTGGPREHSSSRVILPDDTKAWLSKVKKLELRVGGSPSIAHSASVEMNDWHHHNGSTRSPLSNVLHGLEEMHIEQVGPLVVNSSLDESDSLWGFRNNGRPIAKLKRFSIKGAYMNEDTVYHFLRRHEHFLDDVELDGVVFMQTGEDSRFVRNWYNLALSLVSSPQLKRLVMDNCYDAIQVSRPFPAFEVEFDGQRRCALDGDTIATQLKTLLRGHQDTSKVAYKLNTRVIITTDVLSRVPRVIDSDLHDLLHERRKWDDANGLGDCNASCPKSSGNGEIGVNSS